MSKDPVTTRCRLIATMDDQQREDCERFDTSFRGIVSRGGPGAELARHRYDK